MRRRFSLYWQLASERLIKAVDRAS